MNKQAKKESVTQELLHKVHATLDEMQTWSRTEGDDFISDATIEAARRWFALFARLVGKTGKTWVEPAVRVDECGVITATWTRGNKTLTVYLDADEVCYTRTCGADRGYMGMVSEDEWKRIWMWLHALHRYVEGDVVRRRRDGNVGVVRSVLPWTFVRQGYDVEFDDEAGPYGYPCVAMSESSLALAE